MHILPPTLLTLLYLTLTPTCASSPSPPLLSTDASISLWPRDLLFYRQLKDLQTFDSALGGVRASSIMNSGIPDRPFDVGGASFPDFQTAAQRSCDEQFQGCQKAANAQGGGGGGGGGGSNGGDGKGGKEGGKGRKRADGDAGKLTVNMCDDQKGMLLKCSAKRAAEQDSTRDAVTDVRQTSAIRHSKRQKSRILLRPSRARISGRTRSSKTLT